MNFLSLFSGIGGLDLGLERAGMTCVGQVEKDDFCRRVLAKHWPEVPQHDDVRTAVEWWKSEPRPAVDLVCGGFPCQPVSAAGQQLAQADERWLWPAVPLVVRQLRPRWVLLENVPGLLARGMGDVLGDLAACGYDAEWDCIPAATVGAPHRRDRVFVVAYPNGIGRVPGGDDTGQPKVAQPVDSHILGNAAGIRCAVRPGLRESSARPVESARVFLAKPADAGGWTFEPDVGRVAYGISRRVDRLRGLGNAVVPQVAEYVGRLIADGAA